MKPPQRKISYTYRDRRDPDNGLNRTHIAAISHDEDGQNATVLGDIQVNHPIVESQWHTYTGSRERNEAWDGPRDEQSADEIDDYRWDAPREQGWSRQTERPFRYNEDRPLFVNPDEDNPRSSNFIPKGWHPPQVPIRKGRESTLSYMRVAKEGRHIVPTMLGLAQFQTAMSRGNTLIPDKSLSDHSSRMVGRLESAGITQRDPETSANDLTLSRGLKYGDKSKAMHMHDTTTDFDPDTVVKGRRLGRQAVRDSSHLREDPKTPSALNQLKLPGIE